MLFYVPFVIHFPVCKFYIVIIVNFVVSFIIFFILLRFSFVAPCLWFAIFLLPFFVFLPCGSASSKWFPSGSACSSRNLPYIYIFAKTYIHNSMYTFTIKQFVGVHMSWNRCYDVLSGFRTRNTFSWHWSIWVTVENARLGYGVVGLYINMLDV